MSGIITQAVVNPEILPRLSQLSKSFQRIRYHRLRFEVVAGYPTMAGGTYVTGFVKDATDPIKEQSASTTLLASGGTAVKVWQSTEVIVGQLPDLYYTSTAPNSERWSSPGSFVISWISPPTTEGSFSVYVHWDVTLSEATYEDESGGDDAGFASSLKDAYTSSNNPYLSVRDGSSWTPMRAEHFSPKLKVGDEVRLLSFRYGSYENSSGALAGVVGFHTLRCVANGTTTVIKPINELGAAMPNNFYDETYVLFKGEKGELTRAAPNSLRGSWFLSPSRPYPDSPTISGKSLQESPRPLKASPSQSSTSSSPVCSERGSLEDISPTAHSFTKSSLRLETSSKEAPPSQAVTSLHCLVKRMERLLSLQARSTEQDSEEFELLELAPAAEPDVP